VERRWSPTPRSSAASTRRDAGTRCKERGNGRTLGNQDPGGRTAVCLVSGGWIISMRRRRKFCQGAGSTTVSQSRASSVWRQILTALDQTASALLFSLSFCACILFSFLARCAWNCSVRAHPTPPLINSNLEKSKQKGKPCHFRIRAEQGCRVLYLQYCTCSPVQFSRSIERATGVEVRSRWLGGAKIEQNWSQNGQNLAWENHTKNASNTQMDTEKKRPPRFAWG